MNTNISSSESFTCYRNSKNSWLQKSWKIHIFCWKSTENAAGAPVFKIPTYQKRKRKKGPGMNFKITKINISMNTNSIWNHYLLIRQPFHYLCIFSSPHPSLSLSINTNPNTQNKHLHTTLTTTQHTLQTYHTTTHDIDAYKTTQNIYGVLHKIDTFTSECLREKEHPCLNL